MNQGEASGDHSLEIEQNQSNRSNRQPQDTSNRSIEKSQKSNASGNRSGVRAALPESGQEEGKGKKTFVTQDRPEEKKFVQPYTTNDLLFPNGKAAKLCRISNHRSKDIRIQDVLARFKIAENNPVILMIGNDGDERGRILAGMVRAAHNTDAVIIDNGLKSGIEQLSIKRGVKLIGVCPETQIHYPTKNSTGDRIGELTPHTHIFSLGSQESPCNWDDVVFFRFDLATRIRKGRGGPGDFDCKGIAVLVGDSPRCVFELKQAIKRQWPIMALRSSMMGEQLATNPDSIAPEVATAMQQGAITLFEGNAEQFASAVHLYLTITF